MTNRPIRIDSDVLPAIESATNVLIATTPAVEIEVRAWVENFRQRYAHRVFAGLIEFIREFVPEITNEDSYLKPPAELLPSIQSIINDTIRATAIREHAATSTLGESETYERSPQPGREATVRIEYDQPPLTRQQLSGYIDLAMLVGADATIQVLIAAGVLPKQQSDEALQFIAEYIRPFDSHVVKPENIMRYPPSILRIPTVVAALKTLYTKRMYQELIENGFDEMDGHTEQLAALPQIIRERLETDWQSLGSKLSTEHHALLDEIVSHWTKIRNWQPPEHMVDSLEYHDKAYPVPSLRQRIAGVMTEEKRHVYYAFPPGLAKTFPAIASWERTRERRREQGLPPGRMLFVCQPRALDELPYRLMPPQGARISHDGYYQRNHPSVGIIKANIKEEELQKELQKDIVFVSQDMLKMSRGDHQILQHIINNANSSAEDNPFTFLTVDEAHHLNGQGTEASQIRQLIVEMPGLHESGHIIMMSGTPVSNKLDGYACTLRNLTSTYDELLDDVTQTAMPKNRTYNAAELRSASMERLVVLDKPDNWMDRINEANYDMPPKMRRFEQQLIDDDTMTMPEKMHALYLYTLHPRLVSGDPTMPWPLMDKLKEQLEQYLEESDTVLITESEFAEGITRAYQDLDETVFPSIMLELQKFAKDWQRRKKAETGEEIDVHFFVVDGDIKTPNRDKAYRQAEESRRTGTSKTVLIAQMKTIADSINLSAFERMIALQHPYTCPAFEQCVKRCYREGNNEFAATMLIGSESILRAIQQSAYQKQLSSNRVLHGEGVTDEDIRNIERDEYDHTLFKVNGREQRGTEISRYIGGRPRNIEEDRAASQNKGLKQYSRYWQDSDRQREWRTTYTLGADTGADTLTAPDHARAAAAIIKKLADDNALPGNRLLDAQSYSGAIERVLEETTPSSDWDVHNLVMHNSIATDIHRKRSQDDLPPRDIQSSECLMHNVNEHLTNRESDCLVWSDGFQFTKPVQADADDLKKADRMKLMKSTERIKVLMNAHRQLATDGVLVIQVPWSSCTPQQWRDLSYIVAACGFNIIQNYTGSMTSQDNDTAQEYRSHVLTARKQAIDPAEYQEAVWSNLEDVPPSYMEMTNEHNWSPETRRRLKNKQEKAKLRQEALHHDFTIGSTAFSHEYRPDVKERQIQRFDKVKSAVELLRQLHEDGKDLHNLPNEDTAILRELSVFYSPVSSKEKRKKPATARFSYNDETLGIAQYIQPLNKMWD